MWQKTNFTNKQKYTQMKLLKGLKGWHEFPFCSIQFMIKTTWHLMAFRHAEIFISPSDAFKENQSPRKNSLNDKKNPHSEVEVLPSAESFTFTHTESFTIPSCLRKFEFNPHLFKCFPSKEMILQSLTVTETL